VLTLIRQPVSFHNDHGIEHDQHLQSVYQDRGGHRGPVCQRSFRPNPGTGTRSPAHAGQRGDCQRSAVQRVHLPRHCANGGKPAVQGGFDWAHSSGFYAGTWASNISWLEDFGLYTRSSMEWDFYGGYKNTFPGAEDWNYDIGTLYYYYPGKKNPGVYSANTWELYGAIGWKWITFKGSYSLQDYFGLRPDGQKSDGTYYLELNGAYPFADTGFALVGHFGALRVRTTRPARTA
jgi:hypothetical protein